MALRDKTEIFVHCTATRKGWMEHHTAADKVDEIRRWHVEDRGWKDIGYAAIIDRNGVVAWGRDLDKDGDYFEETAAAARGYNRTGIHVALVGGHGGTANDKFMDHFTRSQDEALRNFIEEAERKVGRRLKVRGHNEVANKACPCFQVNDWYHHSKPRGMAGSTTLQATAAGAASAITAGGTAIGSMDGTAQLVIVIAIIMTLTAFAWIFRERIKKWARGVR